MQQSRKQLSLKQAAPVTAREKRRQTGEYSFGLPPAQDAPRGARVLDQRGGFAVALASGGQYLGLYRRTTT